MFHKKKTAIELHKEQLWEDIRKTKLALDTAYSNFDNVLEPELIDCCIYELNATQKRYVLLLKQMEHLEATTIDIG